MSLQATTFGDRTWAPSDLDALIGEDDDWRRYEIVDGVLVVSPPSMPVNEVVIAELLFALRPALPPGFRLVGSIGIVIGRSYRIPDVTVFTNDFLASGRRYATGPEVLLAVEIESPTSITTDRITKPAQYAAAGVAYFWRVEREPVRLVTYRLRGDVYEQTGSWNQGEVARVGEPFDATIDLDCLLPG